MKGLGRRLNVDQHWTHKRLAFRNRVFVQFAERLVVAVVPLEPSELFQSDITDRCDTVLRDRYFRFGAKTACTGWVVDDVRASHPLHRPIVIFAREARFAERLVPLREFPFLSHLGRLCRTSRQSRPRFAALGANRWQPGERAG
jgi:hypothetical protein